tara:strand:- start:4250 stop:5569 length:1320 start_codon:yes stop_codon:yes gene_type:complete
MTMSTSLTIEEACSEILDRRGLTPKKLGSDFTDNGYRVISAKLITEKGLELGRDDPRFVDEVTYKKWMPSPLLEGDVLLTSEAPMGRVAYIKETKEWCLGQRLFCLRSSEGVLGRYLYYVLKSPKVFWELTSRGTGTTVEGIRQSSLREVEIPVPLIEEQKAIAHILGTLDDKIELNQKMNKTLEEIAKAIFKSWFVDFDPVRAKAEGRPTGLPPEISDLFPDEFVGSDVGEIPTGWKVGVIADVADQQKLGISPNNYPDEVFLYFSIPAFDEGQTPVEESGDAIKSNKTIVPAESVLFSKLNPNTPRVWIPSLARERRQICSTEFLVYLPKSGASQSYIWSIFCERGFQKRIEAMVTGTSKSHQRVKPNDILNLQIPIPPKSVLQHFENICAPITQRILTSKQENQILSDLRDTLLPKLISGKLRIPDVEKFLEGAGI